MYTGDESNPYEVHSKKCLGNLSDDIDYAKPQCIECTKTWRDLWRVRKLNKEKKTNLQLIMTPDSKAYLDRDVEITRIDVFKLTRCAIDILAWTLVKNYQEMNSNYQEMSM
jgi:hypothetical protein